MNILLDIVTTPARFDIWVVEKQFTLAVVIAEVAAAVGLTVAAIVRRRTR